MSTNQSLQNLAALPTAVNQVQQVKQAGDNLDEIAVDLEGPIEKPEADEEGNAMFGTAEALATGVLASVLLGPVGGILVGFAQGLLVKKEEQGILDTLSERENALTASMNTTMDAWNELNNAATTPEDKRTLNVIRSQIEGGAELAMNADPRMSAQGQQTLAQGQAGMLAFANTQDQQKIARGALDRADERQLGRDGFADYNLMEGDYSAKSAGWQKRGTAIEIGREALRTNNPAMLNTALVMINKAIDEDSAVLQGEKDSTAAIGSFVDSMHNFLAGFDEGTQMTAGQRRDQDENLRMIADISDGIQSRVDTRFQERAVLDLQEQYRGRFNLLSEVPTRTPLDIPDDEPGVVLQTGSDAKTRVESDIITIGNTLDQGIELHTQQAKDLKRAALAGGRQFIDAAGNVFERIGAGMMRTSGIPGPRITN